MLSGLILFVLITTITVTLSASTKDVPIQPEAKASGLGWFQSSSPEPGQPSPVTFPLQDGFPNVPPGSPEERDIFERAHGTRPNGPPPRYLKEDDLLSLRIIAYTGIFEVHYFTEFIDNVTNNVPGYYIADQSVRNRTIEALTAINAQEEVHVLQANGLLEQSGSEPIKPCKYTSPVNDLKSAFHFADLFTVELIGALQDVELAVAKNHDLGLVRTVTSIVGNEAEQAGWFRSQTNKIPSSNPLLTASSRALVYNAVTQQVVVPNSCPNSYTIDLPLFGVLTLIRQPNPYTNQNQTIQFSVKAKDSAALSYSYIVYVNQVNVPVVEQIQNPRGYGDTVTFSANFPTGMITFGDGLTTAVVANHSGPFRDVNDVTPFTIYGPALIEYN